MKLEFNPHDEKEVAIAVKKLDAVLYKLQLAKAKKIKTAGLFKTGGLALNRAGIKNLADAAKLTRADFNKTKDIGPKVTALISDELHKLQIGFVEPKRVAVKKKIL